MNWQERAACLGDLHFTELPYAEQRPVCVGCPVRFECLADAVETGPRAPAREHVTRGGASPEELARLIRHRPRSLKMHAVHCSVCGHRFESAWGRTKYCSPTCRQSAYAARRQRPVGAIA